MVELLYGYTVLWLYGFIAVWLNCCIALWLNFDNIRLLKFLF